MSNCEIKHELTEKFRKVLVNNILEDERVEGRRYVALVTPRFGPNISDSFKRGNEYYEVNMYIPPFELRYLREGDLFVFLDNANFINPKYAFPTILKAQNTPRERSILSVKDTEPFKVIFDPLPNSVLYISDNKFEDKQYAMISENKVKPKEIPYVTMDHGIER